MPQAPCAFPAPAAPDANAKQEPPDHVMKQALVDHMLGKPAMKRADVVRCVSKACDGASKKKVDAVFSNTTRTDRDNPLADLGYILKKTGRVGKYRLMEILRK